MPLVGDDLGNAIKGQIEGAYGSPADAAKLDAFCKALGDAIVTYIKANAVVNVIGVTPGPGTATGTLT